LPCTLPIVKILVYLLFLAINEPGIDVVNLAAAVSFVTGSSTSYVVGVARRSTQSFVFSNLQRNNKMSQDSGLHYFHRVLAGLE